MTRAWIAATVVLLMVGVRAPHVSAQDGGLRLCVGDEVKALVQELRPQLERAVAIPLSIQTGDVGTFADRLKSGEPCDLALLSSWAVDDLVKAGVADGARRLTVASNAIALGVRSGATTPTIATLEAFKQAMIDARSVVVTSSTLPGATRPPLEAAFDRLGIAVIMRPKMLFAPPGQSARWALDGKAQYVVNYVSNIVAVNGLDLVGTLPEELQRYNDVDAALAVRTAHRAAGELALDVLRQIPRAQLAAHGLVSPQR